MNDHTYIEHMRQQFGVPADGRLNGFISRRNGQLFLDDRINLNELIQQYGAPLEVAFLPLITRQIEAMHAKVAFARQATQYDGEFVFAYATKANFAEEVVRTALQSGAHYETSASADIIIAHQLWRQGILANDRYMFCNGSKDIVYRDAMIALREAGYERIIPIIDDLAELDYLIRHCTQPLMLGVRARFDIGDVDADHPGGERFGLTPNEIQHAIQMLQHTPHQLVLYHAMVGSQMEDAQAWQVRLGASVDAYAALAAQLPDLRFFNFGGGMPTDAYAIDFVFDYQGFLQGVMRTMQHACARVGVAVPHLVGEFGRYTVASHSVYLMEVGAVKAGRGGAPDWYLLNGSLMVSLPDTLIVEGQQFIVLPLDDWHMPVRPVRLAGRYTCDTDDYYPRSGQAPLFLPVSGERSVLAFFGIGAYQQMIAGRGGAHHCLTPEMRRIIIEYEDDTLVLRETPAQHLNDIMVTLGYHRDTIELRRNAATESADRTARVVRMPARRYVRPMRRMPR
ncbi:MAG: arginine decarboxylase [Roseiflexaceae bacterium]|nr:arginine decarboxylase [Chloroflexaceae bacterium]MCE2851748.1 arginine decarboxylase [Chloroflexaceae bacterium]